jgi:hypothetical protein
MEKTAHFKLPRQGEAKECWSTVMKKKNTSKAVILSSIFGPPPVLEGEDAAAYDELLGHICAAVRPIDVIDRIFVNDIVCLQWEILRFRRLKTSLIRSIGSKALKKFLAAELDFDLYRADFEESLAETLQESLSEDQARELARQCARNESDAAEKADKLLKAAGLDIDEILDRTKNHKVEDFVQAYARREPHVVKQINKIFASTGQTMDDLIANAVADKAGYSSDPLTTMERIDHLITVAETRRNAILREIDRHRAVLGGALRQNLQEVEGEFKVIEKTPPQAMSAA